MKIWIDITNTPQVNFFEYIIRQLKDNGHEIIITCRDLSNTINLINQKGWEFIEIGGHAGANKWKKICYFPLRIYQLKRLLANLKPELAVSHSSFYSPPTAKLLGIPSIYLNDNEFAKGNYIAFFFSTLIILPEFLRKKAKKYLWEFFFNINYYPGIKEEIYLSKKFILKKGKKLFKKKGKIYFRPEPWDAEYYKGEKAFIDELLMQLSRKNPVVILPRNEKQSYHFKSILSQNIEVIDIPLPLEKIVSNCILFIGAGGTMTREIAILGILTVSIYQENLLEVDKYLINKKYMYHTKSPDIHYFNKILTNSTPQYKIKRKSSNGELAHNLIIDHILKVNIN